MSNYNEDLQIDKDALDVEWLRQPELYMKYCELAATAKMKAAKANERVKTTRSELVLVAREEGAKNQSESEAYYRMHPDYQKVKQAWIEAQFEADLMNSAQFAFNQRKDALENLVRLANAGYYSAPTSEPPADIGETLSKRAASTREEVKEKISSRRRRKRSA